MAERSVTYLVTAAELEQETVSVRGDGYRHLFRSRRLAKGAAIRLVDGMGAARWSRVVGVERESATLALEGAAATNEPCSRVRLIVPPMRPERIGLLVQKATEIGVGSILFLAFDRAPRRPAASRFDRWRRVARSAVEQCHRSCMPQIGPLLEWSDIEGAINEFRLRVVLDPEADSGLPSLDQNDSAVVIVGPEGGITESELERLDHLGCRRSSLGKRVLRTETAALAAVVKLLL